MSVESHDKKLADLLHLVEEGGAQLPEFQRSWVWDDTKICKLIESISSGFPMGAAMFLQNGGESIRFKCRPFTGVYLAETVTPEWLVLDGQQRLTTLFQVFKSKKPVETRLDTNKDKTIFRYYYLDIEKCLDPNVDRLEAVISVPANESDSSKNKKITSEIGRKVDLDLSTSEMEYKQLMFPLNCVFSAKDMDAWQDGFDDYYDNDKSYKTKYRDLIRQVLFCKFMRKKRIFPSPSRLSKLYLPSIHRVVPLVATL